MRLSGAGEKANGHLEPGQRCSAARSLPAPSLLLVLISLKSTGFGSQRETSSLQRLHQGGLRRLLPSSFNDRKDGRSTPARCVSRKCRPRQLASSKCSPPESLVLFACAHMSLIKLAHQQHDCGLVLDSKPPIEAESAVASARGNWLGHPRGPPHVLILFVVAAVHFFQLLRKAVSIPIMKMASQPSHPTRFAKAKERGK